MREKLIELLDVALFEINWGWGDIPNTDELADHLIANGVTIPVRCKDCKHWDEEDRRCSEHPDDFDYGFDWTRFEADDFCSFGERKADGAV